MRLLLRLGNCSCIALATYIPVLVEYEQKFCPILDDYLFPDPLCGINKKANRILQVSTKYN